jgi:hypothetical protein
MPRAAVLEAAAAVAVVALATRLGLVTERGRGGPQAPAGQAWAVWLMALTMPTLMLQQQTRYCC